jgi:RasGEF domain
METQISFWVARLIVNEERLRSRAKMMTKIIRFAQALYKENNLNSLLAVVSGLNNAAIHRLKFTQEDVFSFFPSHSSHPTPSSQSIHYIFILSLL